MFVIITYCCGRKIRSYVPLEMPLDIFMTMMNSSPIVSCEVEGVVDRC